MHVIKRILEPRLKRLPKRVLLLGPRQVGKSTLCNLLEPQVSVNLADEETYRQHLNDPGLIKRMVGALPPTDQLIFVDEVQRIPSMLNSIQALIDIEPNRRFLLSGSSARKLRRGRANLLPGRILIEQLPPLVYWELSEGCDSHFDLRRALTIGTLPEVYLQEYGQDLLKSYVAGYLREEVQAEALTKDIASYSRFLDIAATLSGQYVNYSKVASDTEINKDAIRRYMEILSDTLLIEIIPSYTEVPKARRARQRERFIFFDLGVRNSLLASQHPVSFTAQELGNLFEQWLVLQVIYFKRLRGADWRISSYRDAAGVEIDLIIETRNTLLAIEIKSSTKVQEKMFRGLRRFAEISKREITPYLVYRGEFEQRFDGLGMALPYQAFLSKLLPQLD